MFILNDENPVNDLIRMIDNDYTYHLRILETLEKCVVDHVSRNILTHESGFSVRIENDDWALAIAMCERYFNQETADTVITERVLALKGKIRCYLKSI
jgi:hypothetical protein